MNKRGTDYPFHGGCLSCVMHRIKGEDYCGLCKYYNFDTELEDKSQKGEYKIIMNNSEEIVIDNKLYDRIKYSEVDIIYIEHENTYPQVKLINKRNISTIK